MTASLFPDMPMMPLRTTTPTQRLRARQDAKIARGVHPISGLKIPSDSETCGSCAHRLLVGGHAKPYPKCEISAQTRGPATDCLARCLRELAAEHDAPLDREAHRLMPRPVRPSRFDAVRAQRILREAVADPDPDLGRAVHDALLALDGYSDGEIVEMHEKAADD